MLIKKEIVFSIPIYNEEKSIENVLREIRKYGSFVFKLHLYYLILDLINHNVDEFLI